MPLTCAVTVILCCFYSGRHATRSTVGWMWFLPAYIALAIAIFLKGPIGLVLPFAVAGGFLVMERQLPPPWHIKRWFQLMHEFGLWWGLPLVLGLSAPWFIWANVQSNGSFFATFFQHHNFDRVFGGSVGDHKLRSHEWYLYGPYLAGYFLPWSLLLPIALWHSWQQRRNAPDPEARFGMAWLLAVILVLSCVGFKRPDYLVPAFPGAAIFLGCVAEQWYQRFQFRRRLLFGFNSLLAGCLAAWFCYLHFFLPVQEPGREYRRFAAAIRRHVPPPGLVLFFRTEAHALAFHLGPEIDTFLEWENLAIWAGRPGCHYIVMPLSCAREWPEHVASGRLEEVIRSTEFAGAGQREKPLVLMRSCPYDNPPCMISRNDLP